MRYNSFNQIHKGLRCMLYTIAHRIQQTDLSSAEHGSPIVEELKSIILLYESHAENEDTFILPLITHHAPEVAANFEAEHVEDHQLGEALNESIEGWSHATSDNERFEYGQKIFYSLNEFIAFNLYHMNKEESLLNGILWKHYSDEEIRLTEQAIIRSTPPEKMKQYATWMIRAINDTELIHWLRGVKLNAPPPLFDLLDSLARTELSPERYRKIQVVVEQTVLNTY